MADLRAPSPASDIFSDEADSPRDQPLLRRSAPKPRGPRSGYVPVHAQQPPAKTGLRGRKTFAFWTLVALLFVLAAGNLLLTATILGVLRLGHGMASLELVPAARAVKFFGATDLGHVYKRDGRVEGFAGEPVAIAADGGGVLLNLVQRNNRAVNKLAMNASGTLLRRFQAFEVRDGRGAVVFSATEPRFAALRGAGGLRAKVVSASRIASAVGEKLRVEAGVVTLRGAEGTVIDGKEIVWNANEDIYLKSDNGSIVLSGSDGTFIDVKQIPIAGVRANGFAGSQFKICVCMPQGKLFRIPASSGSNSKVYCHHINMNPQHNPCM